MRHQKIPSLLPHHAHFLFLRTTTFAWRRPHLRARPCRRIGIARAPPLDSATAMPATLATQPRPRNYSAFTVEQPLPALRMLTLRTVCAPRTPSEPSLAPTSSRTPAASNAANRDQRQSLFGRRSGDADLPQVKLSAVFVCTPCHSCPPLSWC